MRTFLTRKDEHIGAGIFDSIAWAFEVHVKQPDNLKYKFAVLHGSEDYPDEIDFYTQEKPLWTTTIAYTWSREVKKDSEKKS